MFNTICAVFFGKLYEIMLDFRISLGWYTMFSYDICGADQLYHMNMKIVPIFIVHMVFGLWLWSWIHNSTVPMCWQTIFTFSLMAASLPKLCANSCICRHTSAGTNELVTRIHKGRSIFGGQVSRASARFAEFLRSRSVQGRMAPVNGSLKTKLVCGSSPISFWDYHVILIPGITPGLVDELVG